MSKMPGATITCVLSFYLLGPGYHSGCQTCRASEQSCYTQLHDRILEYSHLSVIPSTRRKQRTMGNRSDRYEICSCCLHEDETYKV